MAEVFDILSDLNATGRALETFVRQTQDWRLLSDRLFDIREGLCAAELSLDAWHRKYEVQPKRNIVHLQVLFGHKGYRRIQTALGNTDVVANCIRIDINSIVAQALKARPKNVSDHGSRYSDDGVEASLLRIRKNHSRARKFMYSALNHADDLEMHLEQLHRKLTLLERLSDHYLEKEHPDVFQTIRRLPGRRNVSSSGDSRYHTFQHKLLDGLSARKDAELLHRASQGQTIHIGLSVPRIGERDFAFLLSLNGSMQEVLMHPVKIKAVNDTSRVQSNMVTVIPSLLRNPHESCYMLPSASTSAGFEVSIPPSSILSNLEFKYPLSTLIRKRNDSLTHQIPYAHDQSTLACGLAHITFRLIGSSWLNFLDCQNVRCRKNAAGQWTSMLAAVPGDTSLTRALNDWYAAGPQDSNGTKRMHIFRIGIVLAELALYSPIGRIVFNPTFSTIDILVQRADGENEVVEVEEIAAEVERKTNVFLANMVFSCLSVLQDEEVMGDKSVEGAYYQEVLGQAEELERLMRDWKRASPVGSAVGSTVGTPRSARSARSANVYMY